MYTYFTEKESQDTRRQSKPNQTGIPTGVKRKYEAASGKSFDDVRIHYNSNAPLQLRAYAYTRGNDVYIAPGQEKYLGHELGHVVQQKKGMVRANTYLNGIPLNTEERLEREADRFSRGVSVRPEAGNASAGEDAAQLAPIDWETLSAMWESGYSIPAIAVVLGLSAFAIYKLIHCLRPGKEEKGTSVLAIDTTSPVQPEDDSVRRRDTRSKAPVGKKEISRDTTPKSERGIPGDTTPRLDSGIWEDTTIRPERKPPRDTTPVIPPPVTGAETIRLTAGSGEGTVIPESSYVSDEPKLPKRKRQKGNGWAEPPAETARKEPKRKRQKGNRREGPQEDPAEMARKAMMDAAVAEVLGPGHPVSFLGNNCTSTPCAPNGLFKTILLQKGWIAAEEEVYIYHDTGPQPPEGKWFYLGIRDKAYSIFRARHSQDKGRNNKNYTIRSVKEELGQKWERLLSGKKIWFVNGYICISQKGRYL